MSLADRAGPLTMLMVPQLSPEQFISLLEGIFIDITRQRPGPSRLLGEPVAGLAAVQSVPAFLSFEHQCGALARRFPMGILCAYDVREFDGKTSFECRMLHH